MGRFVCAGLAALALTLAGAGSAAAAPAWLPSEKPFGDTESELATATMSPDGTVTDARLLPLGGGQYTLETRTRPPGGVFATAQTIDTLVNGFEPALLSGPDGTVAVVYLKGVEAWASTRPPGGAFGPPRLLAPGTPWPERLALDGAGRVWFLHEGPGLSSVVASVLGPSGPATHIPVETAPAGAEVRFPSVSVSPAGQVRAAYQVFTKASPPGCQQITELREADGGIGGFAPSSQLATAVASGFGPTCELVSGSAMASSRIASTSDGATAVVYSTKAFGDLATAVLARYRPPGGAWPPPFSPAETVGSAGLPEPSVAGAGSTPVVAIWDLVPPRSIAVASRNADGSWTAPKSVSSGEVGTRPRLASSASGAAIVAWKQLMSPFRIQAVTYSPSAGFSSPVFVSDVQDSAATFGGVGMDDQGNGVVGWNAHVGSEPTAGFRALIAGYDGAGPRFSPLDIPASGFVGQSLGFSAAPVDVWSGAGAPSWQFGDGGSAGGASVSHSYAGAGSYSVSVSASDGLGNVTTASRSLSIAVAKGTTDAKGTAVAKDTTPPVLTKVSLKPRKVKRGKVAKLRFTLSEAATVRVTVARAEKGVRKGRSCVRTRPRVPGSSNKPCRRFVIVRSLAGGFGPGARSLVLPKTLQPASYRVTAVATDAAGNASQPASQTLTVLRPPRP